MEWVMVAVLGALGCVARCFLTLKIGEVCGHEFAYGVLTANIIGSFLIGFLSIFLINKLELSMLWRWGILVGFLGGFTTFSSFSLETVQYCQEGNFIKAGIYIVASVTLCLLSTLFGIFFASKI